LTTPAISRRTVIIVVTVAVLAVAGAAAGVGYWLQNVTGSSSKGCSAGDYRLSTKQTSIAAQMVGEVTRFRPRLPDRAAVLVLAAGLQESKLANLDPGQGDRDSVGVLQQRPSQGWGGGDATKLNDVTEATREFLAALITHKGWQHRPLAKAINDVQISAYESLYAQWEGEARAFAKALLGARPAAMTCTFDAPTLVASPGRVIDLLRAQLDVPRPQSTAGAIRVPAVHRTAWQTAAWFVANADLLGIDSVAYDGRSWSRDGGWVDARGSRSSVLARMART
jgi:hypothetical protein